MREIYLDNSATTRPLPEVVAAVSNAMSANFGNASSGHGRGDIARRCISEARARTAELMGADTESVVFTSGATESNNLAILSCLPSDLRCARVVTTTVEHSSVLKLCDYLEGLGAQVVRVPVDGSGLVDLDRLSQALVDGADLVSVQWVSNETGVIQHIDEISRLAERAHVFFHVDAAQAYGKLSLDVARRSIDYLSVTAHKIHGPQGVGALYVRPDRPLRPLFYGGPQESGRRPGTENLPGIVGFGVAAAHRTENAPRIQHVVGAMRDYFENRIRESVRDVRINGIDAPRVHGTTNLLFGGIDGQALVAHLDQSGIYCSQSSACTNQRPEPSYVLRAMGLSEDDAYSSVRFSFSQLNDVADVERAADVVAEIVRTLRAFEGAGTFAA